MNAWSCAEVGEGEIQFPSGPGGITSEMDTFACSEDNVLRNLSLYFLGKQTLLFYNTVLLPLCLVLSSGVVDGLRFFSL